MGPLSIDSNAPGSNNTPGRCLSSAGQTSAFHIVGKASGSGTAPVCACPACGQQVEVVASDGRVKGYYAIAKQSVDFLIEKQRTAETKAEISAGLMPMREGRIVKGTLSRVMCHGIKGGNHTRG